MDQVDPYVPEGATTFCVPRLPLPITATLNTSTFTAPNHSQRTHEPETKSDENHKNREKQRTKMELCAFPGKKIFHNEKRSQRHFFLFTNFVGCT